MEEIINHNRLQPHLEATVMFIDMNSFFASCEQQDDPSLRGKPVAVCAYVGEAGAVIAPSIEAKKWGVKTGMRLYEAKQLCPKLIPIETHPDRYRNYHVKVLEILRSYCQEAIPKSIDEAVMDFTNYGLVYKDLVQVAHSIKKDIREKAGDWLTCSIGIAPNSFLAKLASDIQKPDGLVMITPDTIDDVLAKLTLRDLPGIAGKMSERLRKAGIHTPLELRHASPTFLKNALKSIVGHYWHCRLNFMEVDMNTRPYKTMQAMRQISRENRKSLVWLNDLFLMLAMRLERRMVTHNVYCREITMTVLYEDNTSYNDHFRAERPIQDGTDILTLIRAHMEEQEQKTGRPVINTKVRAMGIGVSRFIASQHVQFQLFDNDHRKNKLRNVVYNLKGKYGNKMVQRAAELQEKPALKDAIGFGSVKDMHGFD